MKLIQVKLRKNALKKTIALRVFFYTALLFSATLVLYILDILINSNIKFFLFIIILIFLTLFYQYLIFAISRGRKISFNNFKEVLFENELADIKTDEYNHPIIFLFPEFDLFYRLEESILDKLDSRKLSEIASSSIDREKTLQIEQKISEFINQNLDEILDYDLIIKMKRKGKAIFDDLIEKFPELEKLVPYTDPAVIYNVPKIKDRKILIFDDSIHHSKSAQKIIDIIKSIGYNKILFLTIIAQESSLKHLMKKYPENQNIKFKQFKIENEDGYKKFYEEYMFGYLDHVNRSLENDHYLIKLKVDTLINENTFLELFTEDENYIYDVERFIENENMYKISLECPWIYNNIKKTIFNKIKMDMVKVRFFIKLNQPNEVFQRGTTDINLSPALIPREFSLNFCNVPKSKEICMLNKLKEEGFPENIIEDEMKDLICINCLIRNLTNNFLIEFMKYFENKLLEKNNANIVEKSIYPPFPHEIYRKYI